MNKRTRKFISSAVAAALAAATAVSAAAQTVIYTGNPETDYRSGVVYARGLQLQNDAAGDKKGNLYVTSEYYKKGRWDANEYFPIRESSDGGETWTEISGVYDTENNTEKFLEQEDGSYIEVEEGTEGATTYYNTKWSLRHQPTLYELPEALGELPAGTVLCVGLSASQATTATRDTDFDGNLHTRIDIYYSTDSCETWSFLSHVAEGYESRVYTGTAIWEPYLIMDNGKLYCFYSDERGLDSLNDRRTGGQKLVATGSEDGVNWGEPFGVADFYNENPHYRPGMPVVAKMNDGRFIMVYEGVEMNKVDVDFDALVTYYKVTDDIENWDAADHGTPLPQSIIGGSPYCCVMPTGEVVVGAYGSENVFVNNDNLATDNWTAVKTGVDRSYSRCFLPMLDGNLFVVGGGPPYPNTMSSMTCGVVDLGLTTATEGELTVNQSSVIGNTGDKGGHANALDASYTTSWNASRKNTGGTNPTYTDMMVIDLGAKAGLSALKAYGTGAGKLYIFGSNKSHIADALIDAYNRSDEEGYKHFIDTYGVEQLANTSADENIGELTYKSYDLSEAAENYRYLIVAYEDWTEAAIADIKVYGTLTDDTSTDDSDVTPATLPVIKGTQENCTIEAPEFADTGKELTITVTADEGYEFAKLNANGATVVPEVSADGKTAVYYVSSVGSAYTFDAWCDPADNKLNMTEIAAEKLDGITGNTISTYKSLPAGWSDGDVVTSYDFVKYPGLAVFDAGEGNKYNITRVISYARPDMPGRAHFKIYGTNSDPLTADMFTAVDGANYSTAFTALTHDEDIYFGTGAWDTNVNTGGKDAVRGEYEVDANEGYRYIVIQSDHKTMLSLTELKIYGSETLADDDKDDDDDDTPTPLPVSAGTQENCTIETAESGEGVTITVTADENYEFAKLNVNGVTVVPDEVSADRKTAEYYVSSVDSEYTVDAWCDPADNRLNMTEIAAEKLDGITGNTISTYKSLPAGWSDNDVITSYDFEKYPGLAVFDAGEGNKYNITRVISYARPDMPGRAHFKIYGTNSDPLTADMFTAVDGANYSTAFTALTHDEDIYFGTGAWDNNVNTGGQDAVRGEYEVDANEGYRYIVIQADHKTMLSLTELKIYGTEEQQKYGIDNIDVTVNDNTLVYNVSYTAPAGYNLYTAVYNPDNTLAACVLNNTTDEVAVTSDGDYTVKAFLWDENMTPFGDAVSRIVTVTGSDSDN